MNKTKKWLVVANSSYAIIYFVDCSAKSLEKINEFQHAESRAKVHELVTDKNGYYGVSGFSQENYSDRTNPKAVEFEAFARQLANYLNHESAIKNFTDLILFMPEHFHGLLEKHLKKLTTEKIKEIIHKDYTKLTQQELGIKLFPDKSTKVCRKSTECEFG